MLTSILDLYATVRLLYQIACGYYIIINFSEHLGLIFNSANVIIEL